MKNGIASSLLLLAMTLTIGLVLPAAAATSAKTSLTGTLAERFNAISDRLICQCGCNMGLRVCNHQVCPSGIPMRKEIEEGLKQGKHDDAIVQGFVSRMGPVVLSAPPTRGGYWFAWLLPFIILVAGGIWISRWTVGNVTRKKKGQAPKLSKEEEEKFKREWDQWKQP